MSARIHALAAAFVMSRKYPVKKVNAKNDARLSVASSCPVYGWMSPAARASGSHKASG